MAQSAVSWQPYPREWISTGLPVDEDRSFTVMTYNILCDSAAMSNRNYKYVKEGFLKMEDRHPCIMKEVKAMMPDILCLQEVENSNLNKRLIPDLEMLGYKWASCKKEFDEEPQTFYRSDRFAFRRSDRYVAHDVFIDLLKENTSSPITEDTIAATRKYLERPREVVVTQLECYKTRKLVTVANIHTLWGNLEWPTVQTAEVVVGLRTLLKLSGDEDSCFIYTGDFNSSPSHPPYCFLQDGCLKPEVLARYPDKRPVKLDNGETFTLPGIAPQLFRHSIPLRNAYLEVKGNNPDATNCDPLGVGGDPIFIGCLDYIWYNSKTLGCSGVVNTPPAEVLKEEVALPNTKFPSDHIYLMAKMHFL